MGMDVSGLKPRDKAGEYFRNNCWWWRPLWRYCEQVAPDLTAKVRYGQSNDGDGLKTQADCDALADALDTALLNGVEFQRADDLRPDYYPFETSNVREFVLFLRGCGGFAIW